MMRIRFVLKQNKVHRLRRLNAALTALTALANESR